MTSHEVNGRRRPEHWLPQLPSWTPTPIRRHPGAYYAAFHGVTAVLSCRGLSFTKHTAVRAALHRDLIQLGLLPAELGRDYDYLLDLRETADYGGVAEASRASAAKAINKATTILAALEPLLIDQKDARDL
jgi:uncharacterized protein (UPF0332 family)